MFKITLFLFVATCAYFGVDAIKCYNCDSVTDTKCEDPETAPSVECIAETLTKYTTNIFGKNYTFSRAENFQCYNLKADMLGITMLARGCVESRTAGMYCKTFEGYVQELGGKMKYCGTCTTDLCNSAKGLHIHLYPSIACVFAALLASWLL